MPIEIKELHIKAVISGKEGETTSGNGMKPEEIARLKKEMIKEVTDKVLYTLRKKNER